MSQFRDPTEVELRVARALFDNTSLSYETTFDQLPKTMQLTHIEAARVAIRSIGDPTDAMHSAARNVPILGPHATAHRYREVEFRAMIRAASPEGYIKW